MTQTFNDALYDFGIIDVGNVPDDGEIYRYPTKQKPRSKNGYAILFEGGQYGIYGDWQTSEQVFWRGANSDPIRERKNRENFKAKLETKYATGKAEAQSIWGNAKLEGSSPYLERKEVQAYEGVRFDGNTIIVPCYKNNTLVTIQRIYKDGFKGFLLGGEFSGSSFTIAGSNDKTVICEGYATGASIHAATGYTVIVAFNASNIPNVCAALPPEQNVIIAADNDENSIGEKYAKETGRPYIMPKSKGMDFNDLAVNGEDIAVYFKPTIDAFSFADYINDTTPIPDDIIAPRVLTPSGLLVLGGAPKVGKSDFLIGLLSHMAAGLPFMGMTPPRPLKVFYLQAEVGYHYMRERIKSLDMQKEYLGLVGQNLVITPQVRMVLDPNGVEKTINTVKQHLPHGVDIIAIDPLRNVFDGDSENDNAQMMIFLQQRIEAIRAAVNLDAGIILAHHTRKISSDALIEDPFQALSGASSLRGYYTAGMILYRPEETMSERVLTYELRNGARVPDKYIDKIEGRWTQLDKDSSRLVKQHYGAVLDAERFRKRDVILDIIKQESEFGTFYTANQFAQSFEGKEGLGGASSIKERISILATKGYVKFHKDATEHHRSAGAITTQETMHLLPPTHYKAHDTGAIMPDRNPEIFKILD